MSDQPLLRDRIGQGDVSLSREEYTRRFRHHFQDPLFDRCLGY